MCPEDPSFTVSYAKENGKTTSDVDKQMYSLLNKIQMRCRNYVQCY